MTGVPNGNARRDCPKEGRGSASPDEIVAAHPQLMAILRQWITFL
jgi:hypothetical protein